MPRPRGEIDTSSYTGRFAERLKFLREKAKLTMEEVAESLGVSISIIYKYEDGSRTPLVADFPRLAELYKVKRFKDLLPDD